MKHTVKTITCQSCHELRALLVHLFLKGKRFCFISLSIFSQWLDFFSWSTSLVYISLSPSFHTPSRPQGILSDRCYPGVLSFWRLVNAELHQPLCFVRWVDEADEFFFFFFFSFWQASRQLRDVTLFCLEISEVRGSLTFLPAARLQALLHAASEQATALVVRVTTVGMENSSGVSTWLGSNMQVVPEG